MSQPLPKPSCGCSVRIITFDDPMEGTNTTINYCPLHAAAPALVAALQDIRDNSSLNTPVGHIFTQDQLARVKAAIDLADWHIRPVD